MIIVNEKQGSPGWHAARAKCFCASEAPAAMGVSRYMSRTQLLAFKKTGVAPAVDAATQSRFDRGHESEFLSGEIAEGIAGRTFYPVVATRDVDGLPLLASFDGIDMGETVIWEHKLINADLRTQLSHGGNLEPHYWAQMEHQLIVSGAEKALFTAGDGTMENTLHCWYVSRPERRAMVLASWRQFAVDLAAFVPEENAAPPPVGVAPDALPALHVELSGAVTASNLDAFKEHALAVIGAINRTLVTDEQFANAEKTVKWCAEVEMKLAATKEHALSQTATIENLFRTIDAIAVKTRNVRLELDKLVKARKEEIRRSFVMQGRAEYAEFVRDLSASSGVSLPADPPNFADAISGRRTLASMRGAVADALAVAKVALVTEKDRRLTNVAILKEAASGRLHLFPDLETVCAMPLGADALRDFVRGRIASYNTNVATMVAVVMHGDTPAAPAVETPPSGETMNIGAICGRLGFNVTADFLRSIGVAPLDRPGRATLFPVETFPAICRALIGHITKLQDTK